MYYVLSLVCPDMTDIQLWYSDDTLDPYSLAIERMLEILTFLSVELLIASVICHFSFFICDHTVLVHSKPCCSPVSTAIPSLLKNIFRKIAWLDSTIEIELPQVFIQQNVLI